MNKSEKKGYHRYEITTKKAPNIVPHPHRFRVKVSKAGLAKLLLKELINTRGKWSVVKSSPCVYGVFSGPVGGFSPREHLCVGCLRCTTQHPEVAQIYPNPDRRQLGDSYMTPEQVDTIIYEAETGRVPIKGAGYRGKFGGEGWDGMWTDMSEIVRPTRDGIHGREWISTEVDLGERPLFLSFDNAGNLTSTPQLSVTLPMPLLFDISPASRDMHSVDGKIRSEAARQLGILAVFPIATLQKLRLKGTHLVPLISAGDINALDALSFDPLMVEMDGWSASLCNAVKRRFPHAVPVLRVPFDDDIMPAYHAGVRVFHLVADYHGRCRDGGFILDAIRRLHLALVDAKNRDTVSLIGSGGIAAAEHVPKALICGLDAVALDTPLMAALQAAFVGECVDGATSQFRLPKNMPEEWGVQRLLNLVGAWRDQMLEILGAMGLREARRLRGEMGRAMLQKDLEREAFSDIAGYRGNSY